MGQGRVATDPLFRRALAEAPRGTAVPRRIIRCPPAAEDLRPPWPEASTPQKGRGLGR